MYFTKPTTATALAIVAMAVSHFASIRVAAAPVALSQADYLSNGQEAQKLNKQFQTVTVQDPCNDGETGCIAGHFATCSPENDWEVSPCPPRLKCFAMPAVDKVGTTVSCAAPDDALARITDTGATGGTDGDGPSDDNNNNGNGDKDDSSSTSVATTTTAVETGTSTSAPASSDIPEFNIPVGDNLSDILSSITTETGAATSTTAETTSTPTADASSNTSSSPTSTPALSDIPEFSLPVGDNLTDVLSTLTTSDTSSAATSTASDRPTTRVTVTVTVNPTDCSTTDVSETSTARGTATQSNIVSFITQPFSPIPVETSASASDKLTSTSAGYTTASSSSPVDSLTTISSTQTTPLSPPTTGTITPSDDSSEAGPSPTSFVPTSFGDPSIPPLSPTPTPPFVVLPITSIPE